jgi:hypothetical protein
MMNKGGEAKPSELKKQKNLEKKVLIQDLEFKRGKPPIGTSDHLGNPVIVREANKGAIMNVRKSI